MRRSSALAGFIGLVFVCFGLFGLFVAARLFAYANIVLGGFALILWATSSRSAIASITGRRAARYGANAVVYTVAFIGLLAAINYISSLHHYQFDMSAENVFGLSTQSVKVLDHLKEPLKLYGFVKAGTDPQALALYEKYAYVSPMVSFQMVDPDRHPELAERYKVSVLGTTHIQYGGAKGRGTNVTDMTEQAITNGIIKVTKGRTQVVYFLDGHGEADPDDARSPTGFSEAKKALEGENYEVRKLFLAAKPAVPGDCNILVIAGPVKPLMPHEIDAINKYLKRGGRALVMFTPPRPDQPTDESGLVQLAADWGVNAGNDIVVDKVLRLFAGPALGLEPLVDTYGPNPITISFSHRTVFPMTRSVEPQAKPKAGLYVTWLAKTSDTSWAETDLVGIFEHQEAKLDPSDRKGPITVADAVEANLKKLGWGDGDARLVIFGDTQFADNHHIDDFYNRDFFMNSIDWLAGQAGGISIRPRTLRASRFDLTIAQFDTVFTLSVLLLPEALLILGIAVWWKRRV
jgi:gliding motility-associatede transport system auxiliary component